MPRQTRVHRASAQRRRAALVEAAAALVAEVGAGAVTHRAVAARAGVPLSTTSYFFSSIDELVNEALRESARSQVPADDAEPAYVAKEPDGIDAVVDSVVEDLLATSRVDEAGRVEAYLAAGRDPELQADVAAVVSELVALDSRQLSRAGATDPEEAAWMLRLLVDGAMLHRLAGVDPQHDHHLAQAVRRAVAAAALTDEQVAECLGRLEGTFRASAGAEQGGGSDPAPQLG